VLSKLEILMLLAVGCWLGLEMGGVSGGCHRVFYFFGVGTWEDSPPKKKVERSRNLEHLLEPSNTAQHLMVRFQSSAILN
jgi:hypothetical protein